MKRGKNESHKDVWGDDFDRARKRKSDKKSSNYKRKEKYKPNYFNNDEY